MSLRGLSDSGVGVDGELAQQVGFWANLGQMLISTFGVGGFAFAGVAGYLGWRDYIGRREQREERKEWQQQLFGYTDDKGTKIPGVMDRIETIRKEVWDAVDKLGANCNDFLTGVEDRRRQDGISHHQKLDGMLAEVKSMSQGDLQHHHQVETQVNGMKAALEQQSQRLSDFVIISTGTKMGAWSGGERRGSKRTT